MLQYAKNIFRVLLIVIGLVGVSSSNAATAASTTNAQMNFLVFSDIHLDLRPHTMEINPSAGSSNNNDLDINTFTTMLQQIHAAMPSTIRPPNFILVLGDIAGYYRDKNDYYTYHDETAVFQALQHEFPNVPIIMTFGNNDSLEKDYGAFFYTPGVQGAHSSYEIAKINNWLDGFLSTGQVCTKGKNIYPCLISEQQDTTNGHFEAYLASNLRLLSLNSVMFAASKHNTSAQDVAAAQLTWIDNRLRDAELNGDEVIIASHIPFGHNIFDDSAFWRDSEPSPDQTQFYKLLSRYKNNIIGVLSGHTHMEELKVEQDAAGNNVGAIIYTAGLSTSHNNAPSVKTFFLNYQDMIRRWAITNYETFYFHNNSTNTFSLDKLYDFVSYYCSGHPVTNIFDCLSNVNANAIQTYYSAGNRYYPGTIGAPNDIWVTLPKVTPDFVSSSDNDSGSNSHVVYGVLGAAAAAGIGAVLLENN